MISKLCRVQAALKAPKNQRNSFGGYNYRSCEDILEAVKPLLVQEGLLLTITDEIEMLGNRWYVKATATVTDGEKSVSTTAYAREADARKGMDDSQITGSASSYARKYALNGLFCIDDCRDADTMAPADAPKAKPKAKKADLAAKLKEEMAKLHISKADLQTIAAMKFGGKGWSEMTDAEAETLVKNLGDYAVEMVEEKSDDEKLMEGI